MSEYHFSSEINLNAFFDDLFLQLDWRQKLDTQRGACLANELKNNACKLAKWTIQSILAGADTLRFGYVTRYNVKDSSRHVILGTQHFKPIEFGNQFNLNMDNAWGVVRCILDLIMAQEVKNIFTIPRFTLVFCLTLFPSTSSAKRLPQIQRLP